MSHIAALEQQLEQERSENVRLQHAAQRAEDCKVAVEQQVGTQIAALMQQLEQERERASQAEKRAVELDGHMVAMEEQAGMQIAALKQQLEQAEKMAVELAGQLEQERQEKLTPQWEMDLAAHAVVQAAPAHDKKCPGADVWWHLHSTALTSGDCLASATGRCEDLSGSGRGGKRRKRCNTMPAVLSGADVKWPERCHTFVNNGYGQCTRWITTSEKTCWQHVGKRHECDGALCREA